MKKTQKNPSRPLPIVEKTTFVDQKVIPFAMKSMPHTGLQTNRKDYCRTIIIQYLTQFSPELFRQNATPCFPRAQTYAFQPQHNTNIPNDLQPRSLT
jgi:hypothetical protein